MIDVLLIIVVAVYVGVTAGLFIQMLHSINKKRKPFKWVAYLASGVMCLLWPILFAIAVIQRVGAQDE